MLGVDYKLVEVRDKFRKYYNSELKRKYVELEPARRKYLVRFWFWFLLFISGALGYAYFCYISGMSQKDYFSEGALKVYIIYFAIAYGVCFIPISSYKEETKLAVIDKILDFWGEFKYSDKGALVSREHIEQSMLFDRFDEQEQDDAFGGHFHNTEIRVSEQKLVRVIYTRKGRRDKTIFKGILIALNLNKKYNGNTVVCGKSNWKTFLGYNWFEVFLFIIAMVPIGMMAWFTWSITDLFSGQGIKFLECLFIFAILFYVVIFTNICFCLKKQQQKKQVLLEDVIFSKKWKVYADDQIEARYVLTPVLMERMLAIKKLFHGNRIDFSFWDKNLLIAVHTNKDMFETTSLFKSALDYRKVQEVICQLYSIFSVIDVLKLQNESKTGIKKES